jgi:hypothetical protein
MKKYEFGLTDYERRELRARRSQSVAMIGIALCVLMVGIIDKI